MNAVEKTFRVPVEWLNRNLRKLYANVMTYGKYRKGSAMLASIGASARGDGTATVSVKLYTPCHPSIRFVGQRGRIDTHRRADIAKTLKMLTDAQRKCLVLG